MYGCFSINTPNDTFSWRIIRLGEIIMVMIDLDLGKNGLKFIRGVVGAGVLCGCVCGWFIYVTDAWFFLYLYQDFLFSFIY